MFTGLITGVGVVREVQPIGGGKDARFVIAPPDGWPLDEKKPGASIACSGCCLTLVASGPDWFAVEVSAETLALSTLGAWRVGTPVNLEGAMRLGDELGGHLVSGHVDGVAKVLDAAVENGSTRWRFELPAALAKFVAPKGSIAVNGVSLTVNEVDEAIFGVNIIPHTAAHTNFSTLAAGGRVNIEIDMLARYVVRLKEFA